MFVTVVGGTKSQKRRVSSMVEFCAKKLLPRMTSLDIIVNLITIPSDACGYCIAYSEGNNLDRPRDFVLQVDRTNKLHTVLETVAHEMIHLKQYARGELYYSTVKRKHRWHGRWINYRLSYAQQPWEKEAYNEEKTLLNCWLKKEGLHLKKWAQQDTT